MKKLLLVFVFLGMLGETSFATPQTHHTVSSASQCKYKLADAQAGFKDFVAVAFAPQKKSLDGNMQLGFILYHNPKNTNPQSVDAMELVVLDKRAPDKAFTFMVVIIGPQKSVIFKRDIDDDNKPGPCFQKSLEDNPKK